MTTKGGQLGILLLHQLVSLQSSKARKVSIVKVFDILGKELRTLSSRKNTNNNISMELKTGSNLGTLRYWEFIPTSTGKWQIKSYPTGKCLQSMG